MPLQGWRDRPVGRPSPKPKVLYERFSYEARSWESNKRRSLLLYLGFDHKKRPLTNARMRGLQGFTPPRLISPWDFF